MKSTIRKMIEKANDEVFHEQMKMAGEFAKIAATLLQERGSLRQLRQDEIDDACDQAALIFVTCLKLTLKSCQEGEGE